MADLDYAFLAEYATVQDGKLTAVGASYTHLIVPQLPISHLLSIAGRVRASVGTDRIPVSIGVVAPDEQYTLQFGTELIPDDTTRPYGDKIGVLFAATVGITLTTPGLYTVNLSIDGAQARRLAFDVSPTAP